MLETLFYRHKALIICGIVGLLFGPLGLIIGLFLGYSIDRGRPMAGGGKQNQAFFDACFLLLGYVAKLDGQVSEKEIQYARHIMGQLHLSAHKKEAAMRLFYRGKNREFDKQAVLANLRQHFSDKPRMLAQFINLLMRLAYANGTINPTLKPELQTIASAIGLGRLNFSYYDLMFGWQAHFDQARRGQQQGQSQQQYAHRQPYRTPLSAAYQTLGVNADCRHEDLKRAYRRLMSKYHPDKLMSKGLSESEMQKATEKAQQIKSAYEQVCQAQGFRH